MHIYIYKYIRIDAVEGLAPYVHSSVQRLHTKGGGRLVVRDKATGALHLITKSYRYI